MYLKLSLDGFSNESKHTSASSGNEMAYILRHRNNQWWETNFNRFILFKFCHKDFIKRQNFWCTSIIKTIVYRNIFYFQTFSPVFVQSIYAVCNAGQLRLTTHFIFYGLSTLFVGYVIISRNILDCKNILFYSENFITFFWRITMNFTR